MKPTAQISAPERTTHRWGSRFQRLSPLTDYGFQSTVTAHVNPKTRREPVVKPRMFWRASTDFFGGEMIRDFTAELTLFALITAVSAWPIVLSLVAITRMVRNY